MREQTLESLDEAGIKVSELAYRRRVLVAATTTRNNDLANVLEFTMPLNFAKGGAGLGRLHLNQFLGACAPFLTGEQSNEPVAVGEYKSWDVIRPAALYEMTQRRLLEEAERFALGMAVGERDVPDEVSFEIPGDVPTQRLELVSWYGFCLSAQTATGWMDLKVDYPERHRFGMRPIDDIQSFLQALNAWFFALCREHRIKLMDDVKKFRQDFPREDVPDYRRQIDFNAGQTYEPLFGHNFSWSGLRLTADSTQPPAPSEIAKVLRYFRDQLIANVPTLSVMPA